MSREGLQRVGIGCGGMIRSGRISAAASAGVLKRKRWQLHFSGRRAEGEAHKYRSAESRRHLLHRAAREAILSDIRERRSRVLSIIGGWGSRMHDRDRLRIRSAPRYPNRRTEAVMSSRGSNIPSCGPTMRMRGALRGEKMEIPILMNPDYSLTIRFSRL